MVSKKEKEDIVRSCVPKYTEEEFQNLKQEKEKEIDKLKLELEKYQKLDLNSLVIDGGEITDYGDSVGVLFRTNISPEHIIKKEHNFEVIFNKCALRKL